MATKQFLETKVAELEKMREASDQQIDDKLVMYMYSTCCRS